MVQVINNQAVQGSLPNSGYLKSGESVSRYDLLSIDILMSEGWLPNVDNKPIYNALTQMLVVDTYIIQATQVIINYKAVPIPAIP